MRCLWKPHLAEYEAMLQRNNGYDLLIKKIIEPIFADDCAVEFEAL